MVESEVSEAETDTVRTLVKVAQTVIEMKILGKKIF